MLLFQKLQELLGQVLRFFQGCFIGVARVKVDLFQGRLQIIDLVPRFYHTPAMGLESLTFRLYVLGLLGAHLCGFGQAPFKIIPSKFAGGVGEGHGPTKEFREMLLASVPSSSMTWEPGRN